jgi:hypothetical protein
VLRSMCDAIEVMMLVMEYNQLRCAEDGGADRWKKTYG